MFTHLSQTISKQIMAELTPKFSVSFTTHFDCFSTKSSIQFLIENFYGVTIPEPFLSPPDFEFGISLLREHLC